MILKNDFPVFLPNQILSHDQLNDIVGYLEPRDRATRIHAVGRGLLCGLKLSSTASSLNLEPGAGLTSAGYLAAIERPYTFRYAADFQDLSHYPPFLAADGETGIKLLELFEEEPDEGDPVALTELDLAGYVALLFLHDYEQDLASCLVDDCDNLGAQQNRNWHVLLITKASAVAALQVEKAEVIALAKSAGEGFSEPMSQTDLEKLLLRRYDLTPLRLVKPLFPTTAVTDYTRISNAYHAVCWKEIDRFAKALGQAYLCFLPVIGSREISPRKSKLLSHFSKLTDKKGLQYFHDFLGDLVDGYNEFLSRAQEYAAACGTDQSPFSHHLLLGLAKGVEECRPTIFRHYFREARVEYAHGDIRQEMVFLFDRLLAMIDAFVPDFQAAEARITPEHQGDGLRGRAIPCYYDFTAIQPHWSFTDSRFCRSQSLPSYHNPDYSLIDNTASQLNHYRIEGHLYRDRDTVLAELESLRAEHNLAFKIQTLELGEVTSSEGAGGCSLEELRIIYQLARLDSICFLEDKIRYLSSLVADDLAPENDAVKEIAPTPFEEALKLNYLDVIDFSRNSIFENQAIFSEIINQAGETPAAAPVTSGATPAAVLTKSFAKEAAAPPMADVGFGLNTAKKSKYEQYYQEKDLAKEELPLAIKDLTDRQTGVVAAAVQMDFIAGFAASGPVVKQTPVKEISDSLIVEANNIAMVFPKTKITDYRKFPKPVLADRLLQELVGLMAKVLEQLPLEINDFDQQSLEEAAAVIKDKALSLRDVVEDLIVNTKYVIKGFEYGLIDQMLSIIDSCVAERLKNIADLHDTRWQEAQNASIFAEFVSSNPGIEHLAGVPKGGTFILVNGTIDKTKKINTALDLLRTSTPLPSLARFQEYRGNVYEKMLRTASHFSPKAFTWTKLIDRERAATAPAKTQAATPTKKGDIFIISEGSSVKTASPATVSGDIKIIDTGASIKAQPLTVSTRTLQASQKTILTNLLKKMESDPTELVLFDFCLPYISQMCAEIRYIVLAELKLYLPKESFCAGDLNSYAFAVYPPGGTVSGPGVKKIDATFYFVPAVAPVGELLFTYTIGGRTIQLASRIHPQPQAAFTYEVTSIDQAGAVVEFTNLTVNGESFAWTFGDGDSSEDHSPVHTFDLTEQNNFTVTLQAASGAACVDQISKEINLIPILFKLAAQIKEFCTKDAAVYDFVMDPPGGTLDGEGLSEDTFSPAAVIMDKHPQRTVPITYKVNEQTAVVDLTVFAEPVVDFATEVMNVTADSATVKFIAKTTSATVYFWDFGDGGKATTTNTQHTYKLTGGATNYTVALTCQNGPCAKTKTQELDLSPLSFTLKINKTVFCSNNSLAYGFNVSPAGGVISGPGIEADKFKPSLVDVGTQSSRTVTLQYVSGTQTATMKVMVYHAPELKLSHTLISQTNGFAVQFTNLSSYAVDYQWDFGDGTPLVKEFSPSHTYKAEGLYTVTLMGANPGCEDKLPQQILIQKTVLPGNDKMIPAEPISGLLKLLKSTLNPVLLELGLNPAYVGEFHAKVLESNGAGKIADYAANETVLIEFARAYLEFAAGLPKLTGKPLVYGVQVYKLALANLLNIMSMRKKDLKPTSDIGKVMAQLLTATIELNKTIKISQVVTENFILQPVELYQAMEMLAKLRQGFGENL